MSDSRSTTGRSQDRYSIGGTTLQGPTLKEEPHSNHETAHKMAVEVCKGYRAHDDRDRAAAIESFGYVDDAQFDHLTSAEAYGAAAALVDALWAKDEVEAGFVTDGVVERPDELAEADWSGVESALRRRARIIGMDEDYGRLTTESWKQHKVGGQYSVPVLEAQRLEVRAALGTEAYPSKDRAGRSGYGELPTRYLVAVELHDDRSERAQQRIIDVMTPYFETILEAQERY